MNSKVLIQRIFQVGLFCGVLIAAMGFANVFDKANPLWVVIFLAPYAHGLLVLGIVISAITGVGLLVVRQRS